MEKPTTPSNPAILCPRSWVISKTEAIASPIPAMTKNHTPTLPALVVACDQSATANAHELIPQARNISDTTQRYCPSAYSLTIRQEGLNSGLSTCKLARNRSVAADAPAAKRAAGIEFFELSGVEIAFSIALLMYPGT